MEASFKSEAIKVLKKSRKPLNFKEIAEKILKRGNIKTKGSTPEATLHSVLLTDVKNKGIWSAFVKNKEGSFALNPNYREPIKKSPEKVKEKEETIILLGQTIKSKGNKIR